MVRDGFPNTVVSAALHMFDFKFLLLWGSASSRLACLHVSSRTGANCKRHRLTRLVYLTIFPKNLPQTPTTRLDLICAFNLEISSKVAPITKSRLSFSENQLLLNCFWSDISPQRSNSLWSFPIVVIIIVWRLLVASCSITVNWRPELRYLEEFKHAENIATSSLSSS